MPLERIADKPLPFGKITLCQIDYREFVCSKETVDWLMNGGMTHLDGNPVYVTVSDELVGGHNVVARINDRWEKGAE